ncbi:MAG: zf-HC2 domain-containing protein [Terracidiphilus sp.]|jgi:hypothetical protein
MAERNFNPSSTACGQWERLLAEALDGLMRPEDEVVFTDHMAHCPVCAKMFEEARKGCEWLEFLSPDPEIPDGLVERILAQTGPGHAAGYGLAGQGADLVPMPPLSIPVWQPGFMASIRRFAEPRLMMTAAMAFFSIGLTLNLTGVHLDTLQLGDLRPSALRAVPGQARSFLERRLTMASTPIVRYYDHSRLAYEVQIGMRELRRSTQGLNDDYRRKMQEQAPGESRQAPERRPAESPQQSATPAVEPTLGDGNFMVSSRMIQNQPALSGGAREQVRERSTVWTA